MSVSHTIHNDESQIGERRFWPRETLEWVVLVYFGQNNWGKLINLSKGGMRFEFAQPPSDPGPINFRFEAMGRLPSSFGGDIIIDSFQAAGDIRWTSNFERTAGVQFANLDESSRQQIQKWLSFGHSADSGRSSNATEPEAPVSPAEPFQASPPPSETRLELNEDDMQLEVGRVDPGSEPYEDSLEDLTFPLVAETPEEPVFQDYSHAMPEEENKNAEASGSYLRLSRAQVTGVLVGMAAAVVIGGLGMILQRLAYRVPSFERAASPAVGEGESVSAEYVSAAGSQRPFLVEVLDANNRRWLLWFDDSSSKNAPTQAAYKSSLPFSTSSLRGASPLKQTAPPKPSALHKFTLVAPQASRPQVNSSTTNSPSLVAPLVRDELQPPLQAPIVDILSSPAIPAMPSAISESVPVGGQVQKARLVKSVPPVYPPFAKSSRVGGDVILDALIDSNGNVTELKAISGPAMLRQAAMDAVKHWKYEPARLNGRPVALHLAVTVKFRFE